MPSDSRARTWTREWRLSWYLPRFGFRSKLDAAATAFTAKFPVILPRIRRFESGPFGERTGLHTVKIIKKIHNRLCSSYWYPTRSYTCSYIQFKLLSDLCYVTLNPITELSLTEELKNVHDYTKHAKIWNLTLLNINFVDIYIFVFTAFLQNTRTMLMEIKD